MSLRDVQRCQPLLVGPNSEGSSGLGPKTKAAWWISEARVRVLIV
jgi:hypothetical protein